MAELSLPITSFIRPALKSKTKFVVTTAGRRTGKTQNHANWINQEGLRYRNMAMLWVDTTQGNIEKYVDRYFQPVLKPIWSRMRWDKQRKILTYPTGSYVDFGSAERPELLEGFGYKRAVLNEAGIIMRKKGLWDNTIYPMVKDEDALVKITGTPKGRNKFHELYRWGKSPDFPQYESFHFTIYDSPYYTLEEIEHIRRTVPDHVWQQEYMAEFLEGAGTVFRNVRACIQGVLREKPSSLIERYWMAIDLAKWQDFTVIMVMNEQNQIVWFDRFNQIDWTVQKARILRAYETWNKPLAIIDSSGVGDAIFDDLVANKMRVHPFKFTEQTKNNLIRNLIIAIENQEITFPEIEVLLDELEMFEYDVRPSGLFGYSAPEGFHDDTVIALALLNELRTSVPNPSGREIKTGGTYDDIYSKELDELKHEDDSDTLVIDEDW